jgi:hypothetical protein
MIRLPRTFQNRSGTLLHDVPDLTEVAEELLMPPVFSHNPIKKQSYRRRQSGQKIAQPTTLALQVVTKLEHSALDRQ